MNGLKFGALSVLAFAVSGCGGGAKEPLAILLEALSEPNVAPALLTSAFVETLSVASRARLKAEADQLSQTLGIAVRPDEIIRVDGLPSGLRLGGFEVVAGDGAVELAFANLDPKAQLMATPVIWKVVREEGQLRLHLPENTFGVTKQAVETAL